MTKQEAAEILGIPVTATAEEVRRRYQEVFSDFQIRLTNAPTAQLRKTYQGSLRDFQLACEVLAPGVIADSGVEDLPAAQPSAPAYQSPTATAQASRRPSPAPPIPTPTVPGALPKSTIVVGVVAVLLAAISSFLAMQWGKLLSLEEAMRGDTAQQMQAIEKLSGEAQGLRQALELLVNGQFVIRNAGRSALHVSGLAAAYRDPATGGFKTFNSASYDYPTWDIRSGGQNLLRFVKGQDVVWDGAVIFYALEVQYEEETYFLSGTWSTVKGKVLELSLDG